MHCCEECFNEKEIVMYIQSQDMIGNCDFCDGKEVNIGELEGVGEFIREGFSRAYDHVEDFTGSMWDSEEKAYIGVDGEETGESILNILYCNERIFSAAYDKEAATVLLQKLIDASGPSDWDKKDGDTDVFEDIQSECFVLRNALYGTENVSEYYIWKEFKNTCKYYNRYFDISPSGSKREALLSGLHDVFMLMEAEIDEKTILYRARGMDLEAEGKKLSSLNLFKEVAPAPAIYSTNNRMSPAGISYTYLTTDIKTGLEEICASENKSYLAGRFSPRMNLKLLDLSKNAEIKLMSIFDDNYKHEWIWLSEFVDEFIDEISKTISKEDTDLEYVATQVLSEYVRKLGYDGIKYESSKVKGTYNYVLFCGPNPNLCRECYVDYNFNNEDELFYFSQWLKLEDVQYIKYIGAELEYEVIESINNIEDIQKDTLLQLGKIKFRKFAEISRYLSELQELLDGKDSVFVDNIEKSNFSLSAEVEYFINKHNENVIRYIIEVSQEQSELYIGVVSYCSDRIAKINISTSVKIDEPDFAF
ncbi:RES domain-containing protein [Bacillus cereus]|nr:RES domain-containing protein [Bacillus cereus]MEC2757679.1 RES domain-containing protein [Bacillus cereus]MEC2830435.1 RES domain-containing protein [Bacillus cereus]